MFAHEPVKLDWVPPNVTTDIVNDYMTELGTNHIPVAGSDAAAKRKKQLEFQIPVHDLDPNLCDNLTEKEEEQLNQYVSKIKENCVGQGNIVRIGSSNTDNALPLNIQKDKLATFILNSEPIYNLMHSYATVIPNSVLPQTISTPLKSDYQQSPILTDKVKYKLNLMNINSQAIQSGTVNGPFYDEILNKLHSRPVDFQNDNLFKPMDDFRREYLNNNNFKSNVDQFVGSMGNRYLDTIQELDEPQSNDRNYETPQKNKNNVSWNSPLPFRAPNNLLKQGRLVQQETPMRKAKFTIDCDKILSDAIDRVIQNPMIFNTKPLPPDFEDSVYLSPPTKSKLKSMNLNTDLIKSYVNNPVEYDKILDSLKNNNINYSVDNVLAPIEQLKYAMEADKDLKKEVDDFVDHNNSKSNIKPSKSTDSGFESTPPTPNYGTYPGLLDLNASQGKIMGIPGISDMNMYPSIKPMNQIQTIPEMNDLDKIRDLNIGNSFVLPGSNNTENQAIKCNQCKNNIYPGDVAVKAERAGKDIAWHPKCFVCFQCKELLADLVYFFHTGNVYCARDLAVILKIPRCQACDELIFTKEYTAAEGATFHIKHFCCYQCDTPLAGQQYLPDEKTNMPLCLKCYDEFHAELCQRCNMVIKPTEQGVAWAKIHWHGTCFICSGLNCGKSLIGGRFCVKNNMPFCSSACVNSLNM